MQKEMNISPYIGINVYPAEEATVAAGVAVVLAVYSGSLFCCFFSVVAAVVENKVNNEKEKMYVE